MIFDATDPFTPVGEYSTSHEVKDGKLIYIRSLVMNRSTVGIDRYKEVRDFITNIPGVSIRK